MGERKVLNKYYPPDFDSIRLPKLPGGRPDQYVIRIMAPFTMRCLTCGNYVYKGRKFNSRKEDAKGEKYLGIQIYRFYIRCPECLSEITFKTDPENSDYVPEHNAIRTFQAERLAELEEERTIEEQEEEEANNPMLALENRTAESRREMDVLDALEEIRDFNSRTAAVKHEHLLEGLISVEEKETKEEEEVLRVQAAKIFEEKRSKLRRLEEEEDEEAPPTKQAHLATPLPRQQPATSKKNKNKLLLLGMVIKKSHKTREEDLEDKDDDRIKTKTREKKEELVVEEGEEEVKLSSEGSKNSGTGGSKAGLAMLCNYSDTSSDSD